MTTRTLTLPEPLDAFVDDQVASGAYPDADAVVTASLRLLQDDAASEADKMERLRAKLQSGLDQLDRGEGIEVVDLETYFDQLEARALGR
jgi:antitoxin ParD1/3/4